MSKKKVINGKDYRWDYQKKKWVQSHGSSGGEAIAGFTRSVVGLFNRDKAKIKKNGKSNGETKVTDHKDTGHTKLVKDSSGKVRRVKVSDTTKDKTLKGSDTRKIKKSELSKEAWLKKTRNSPAAKSGAFTDDERWAQQQKHRTWKANRKAKTAAKKTPVSKGKSPEKVEITKNKNEFKIAPKDIPAGKVKMKDGSIVDRSSLYTKKKK